MTRSRSALVSSRGRATGVPISVRKKGLRLYVPLRRVPITDFISPSMPTRLLTGVDSTRPRADFVLTTIRTGPNDSCSDGELLLRQLSIKPTYGILKSRGVFPIGVLQQLAYQRSRP